MAIQLLLVENMFTQARSVESGDESSVAKHVWSNIA